MSLGFVTPPQLAEELGVKPHKILHFIRSGELKASDLSERQGEGRPRYRIARPDIQAFLDARASRVEATKKIKPRKRRVKKPDGVETFC